MKHYSRGFGAAGAIGIVALIIVIGGGILLTNNRDEHVKEEAMMEEGSMEKEDSMMEHSGDAMGEEAMMNENGSKMEEKNDGDAMESEGTPASSAQQDGMMDSSDKEIEGAMDKEPVAVAPEFMGTVLAGGDSPLIDFNKEDYEAALASDKLVVLYFYASWCPTCKSEVKNGLYPAFGDLSGEDVVGFQINFNDSATTKEEKKLAADHKVTSQHTKIFLKNGEQLVYSPHTWSKSQYLEEIAKAI